MTFLDLFAGIGGFRSGLEKEGFEAFGYVEWDKFARQTYEAIYETEGEWTRRDITEVTEEEWGELQGEVDIITGGFPCQAFSMAGERKGFEDTRGTLFFDIARAARIIKPKVILMENVKGLVSHDKGKTLDTIVKVLGDTGYLVDFEVLNSKHYGVPQNRERVFIIAVREDLLESEKWTIKDDKLVSRGKMRIQKIPGVKTFNFDFPSSDTEDAKIKDILEDDVRDSYYLSDEIVERLIWKEDRDHVKRELGKSEGGTLIGASRGRNPKNTSDRRTGAPTKQRLEINPDEVSNTLTSVQKDNYVVQKLLIREAVKKGYNVAEEGDSVNFLYPNSKTRRGRVGKQIANTLQAGEPNQGVVVREAGDSGESKLTIRKFTPLESWRIQGFTDEQFYKARQDGVSDTQLYKQAGNAVTVNVIEAIAKKLKELLKERI